MPNGFGQGRVFGRGSGGGMGFGFRGSSPPWPYVGRGRGGLPRCGYYFGSSIAPASQSYQPQSFYSGMPPAPGYAPYSSRMTREDELNYMKGQAEALRDELKQLETEIGKLSAEKSKE
jgi:hypothetical protein